MNGISDELQVANAARRQHDQEHPVYDLKFRYPKTSESYNREPKNHPTKENKERGNSRFLRLGITDDPYAGGTRRTVSVVVGVWNLDGRTGKNPKSETPWK